MDKVKQLSHRYWDCVAHKQLLSAFIGAGEHQLTGGSFTLTMPLFIDKLFLIKIQVGVIKLEFSDKCTCPVPKPAKCNLILSLVTSSN